MTDPPVEPAVVATDPQQPVPSRAVTATSVVAIWMLTGLLGVLIAIFSTPGEYASWLSLTMGVSVIAAFAAQLALRSKEGFVNRVAVTLSGNVLIVAIIAVIFWISAL